LSKSKWSEHAALCGVRVRTLAKQLFCLRTGQKSSLQYPLNAKMALRLDQSELNWLRVRPDVLEFPVKLHHHFGARWTVAGDVLESMELKHLIWW
jgi:hypothetical protein